MKKEIYLRARERALALFQAAHIALTSEEKDNVEVADFGLDDFERTGLMLITYINTSRCCAKEMAMLPGQTCPEHCHAPLPARGYTGKEETFRCRYGQCTLYVAGEPEKDPACRPPEGDEAWYTVWHQVVLRPGEQYTILPNTPHWFQAGPEGAVISEFSTTSYDEYDIFTDPRVQRAPTVE